eukprot:3526250-Rhodomonas_salina.1
MTDGERQRDRETETARGCERMRRGKASEKGGTDKVDLAGAFRVRSCPSNNEPLQRLHDLCLPQCLAGPRAPTSS